MKRLICMLCILLFVPLMCACSEPQTLQNTYSFYYCATDPGYGINTGVFAVEERETACKEGDYPLLIEEYLRGPRISNCTSPFPGGTYLEEFSLSDGTAVIILSPHMAFQTTANLVVCCACLSKTLFMFEDIHTIQISIQEYLINGEEYLTFTRNSFSEWDDYSYSAFVNLEKAR